MGEKNRRERAGHYEIRRKSGLSLQRRTHTPLLSRSTDTFFLFGCLFNSELFTRNLFGFYERITQDYHHAASTLRRVSSYSCSPTHERTACYFYNATSFLLLMLAGLLSVIALSMAISSPL